MQPHSLRHGQLWRPQLGATPGAEHRCTALAISHPAVDIMLPPVQARAAVLERELADSERTHALRDKATAVLKEEIAELR